MKEIIHHVTAPSRFGNTTLQVYFTPSSRKLGYYKVTVWYNGCLILDVPQLDGDPGLVNATVYASVAMSKAGLSLPKGISPAKRYPEKEGM